MKKNYSLFDDNFTSNIYRCKYNETNSSKAFTKFYLIARMGTYIDSFSLPHKLLYLEHEALILVFRVPQSVQKVKTAKFHKHLGIMEQKSELSNQIFNTSSSLPSKNITN